MLKKTTRQQIVFFIHIKDIFSIQYTTWKDLCRYLASLSITVTMLPFKCPFGVMTDPAYTRTLKLEPLSGIHFYGIIYTFAFSVKCSNWNLFVVKLWRLTNITALPKLILAHCCQYTVALQINCITELHRLWFGPHRWYINAVWLLTFWNFTVWRKEIFMSMMLLLVFEISFREYQNKCPVIISCLVRIHLEAN